ncbi:MAG TPA: PaaI family thioesterase [Marinospirillum sp.]|uniref:PaaI family thioesterase n=1 Tax=Marinospirillum sp. TaxID=2183934 RepID=UPI002B476208|nr:PaaI family thioesterase [Marinospirillum sp.]HKM14651.1 PaaI family thioesterase [Marinospirillum sp.]
MTSALKMTHQALAEFLHKEFPQYIGEVCEVAENYSLLRQPINESHLRPGRTVSGPTLMALADVALYVAILSKIGPVALTVTTDLTIHFLNKPRSDRAIMAKASLLKQGKRLIIGEVELYSEGEEDIVAHVVATYSVPPITV